MTAPGVEITLVSMAGVVAKPPPVCGQCGQKMWWHGGALGGGCPSERDKEGCRSALFRPRPDGMRGPWLYSKRYPELAD